jgi:ADP-heptose:LPS heptosyltransferase
MLVNFKINRMPHLHIVDRYFEAAGPLKITNDQKGLDFFIPAEYESVSAELPQSFSNGFVAVVIGAQHFTKRMPNQKLIALCQKIHLPVVLIGGKEDVQNAMQISDACGNKVYNACGKYNLFQSASLIRQAALVIAHDTGMMHIAAAFNKKIISIWGNTVPEFGMYPYLPMHPERSYIAEVKNLKCRPCSKIGKTACPKEHFKCMQEIDIDIILKQAVLFTT